MLEDELHVGAILCRKRENGGGGQRLAPKRHGLFHLLLGGKVDFVDEDEHGDVGGLEPLDGLFLYLLVGDIDHEEDEVGVDEGHVDELVHHLVHLVGRVLDDAGGVGEDDLEVVAVHDAQDAVACGLRFRRDDGDFLSNELIHKGGFAHIRAPYNVDIACFMCHNEKFSRFFALQRNKIIIFAADFGRKFFSKTGIFARCGVEQRQLGRAHNPEVGGSNPPPATNKKSALLLQG